MSRQFIYPKAGSSVTDDMLWQLPPKMLLIASRLACLLKAGGCMAMIVTSIYRPKEDDSGVHADWRGVDVSIQGIPEDLLLACQETINKEFPYDPARPGMQTLVIHTGVGYNNDVGRHIHLQVMA